MFFNNIKSASLDEIEETEIDLYLHAYSTGDPHSMLFLNESIKGYYYGTFYDYDINENNIQLENETYIFPRK